MKNNKYAFVAVALLCISSTVKLLATDTIQLSSNFYHIDHARKLIISNENVITINTQWPNLKSALLLDELYDFSPVVNILVIGTAYSVSNNDNVNYTLYFTQLPIVHIHTIDSINGEEEVLAHFSLHHPIQEINEIPMGIRYRGGSSQSFPKKSFRIELWEEESGEEPQALSLLGMRNDDDWNLQAMYNEPLRLRSKNNFKLWENIHPVYYQEQAPDANNSIEMKYVEVLLNGSYRGLYTLTERIDKKQLQLKSIDDEITGELYKGIAWGAAIFANLPSYNNNSTIWSGFEHKYPDEIDWSNLYSFVDFVIYASDDEFYTTYANKFDLHNAIDYFLFLNLLRATDNTGKNIYIAKYKHDEPYFYVPWDLDGTIGIIWDGEQDNTTNDILSNGFYDRLLNDCREDGFVEQLQERWTYLRLNVLSHQDLINEINQQHNFLLNNACYEREQIAWNEYTYDESNLSYLSTWLANRLSYLDNQMIKYCDPDNVHSPEKKEIQLYPNPTNNGFRIFNPDIEGAILYVKDIFGKTILNKRVQTNQWIDLSPFPPGSYIVWLQSKKYKFSQQLMKF